MNIYAKHKINWTWPVSSVAAGGIGIGTHLFQETVHILRHKRNENIPIAGFFIPHLFTTM